MVKCQKCGFEMSRKYLKDNYVGMGIPDLCKECVDVITQTEKGDKEGIQ